ncbi:hypothetical protein EDD85DRAFT_938465 [Armillaria nabsnona]|nr:hypothetical protein EDD85DRAFT_938465 [Armillaria nabsnona]
MSFPTSLPLIQKLDWTSPIQVMQSLSHFQALQDRTTVEVICLSVTTNLRLHLHDVPVHVMQAKEIGQVPDRDTQVWLQQLINLSLVFEFMRDASANFSTTSAYEAVDCMSELYGQVLSHAVLFLDYPQICFASTAILKAFVEAQAKARARKDLLAIRALDAGLARVGGSLVEMSEDVMLEFAVRVDSQGNMSYPTVVAGEELQSEDDDESEQLFQCFSECDHVHLFLHLLSFNIKTCEALQRRLPELRGLPSMLLGLQCLEQWTFSTVNSSWAIHSVGLTRSNLGTNAATDELSSAWSRCCHMEWRPSERPGMYGINSVVTGCQVKRWVTAIALENLAISSQATLRKEAFPKNVSENFNAVDKLVVMECADCVGEKGGPGLLLVVEELASLAL